MFAMPFALATYLAIPKPSPLDIRIALAETANVTTLLKDLSAKSGVPLSINERRGQEILIVAVNDAPLADVMKQIAWATYGRWETSGSGYRLLRDTDAEKAAEKEYVRWQSREASAAIAKLKNRVLKLGMTPDRVAGVNLPWEEARGKATPGDVALATALATVPTEKLVFMYPDSWCVFSNQPTAAEYPLPHAADILKAYNKAVPDRSDSPATRAMLSCDYRFEVGTAVLRLYSDQGGLLGFASATFPLHDRQAPRPVEFADEIPNDPVPLSEASQWYVRPETKMPGNYFGVGPSWNAQGKIDDIVQRLRNPERFEPLANFATDVWRTVAKSKGRNLVANIDDVFMYPGWANQTPKLGDAFRTAGGYNSVLQPGWLLARPSLPTPPWRHRTDRQALGRLLRATPNSDFDQFDARATFAAVGDLEPDAWETNQYLAWADVPAPDLYTGWRIARLYGTLTPQQKGQLLSGNSVPVAAIPDAAKRAVRKFAVAQSIWDSSSGLDRQPTVRFPLGLPQEGLLVSVADSNPRFEMRWKPKGGPVVSGMFGFGHFAQIVTEMEQNDPAGFASLEVRDHPFFSVALSLQLSPNSQAYDLARFSESRKATGAFYKWANVSEALKQRVRDYVRREGGG